MTRGRTWVEAALGRQRAALAVIVLGIPLACWTWVVLMARDMYGPMTGASRWMMTPVWDAAHLVLLWAMWAAMMAAMMLPSATPILMLYAGAARNRDAPRAAARIYGLAGGYVLVWGLFSVGATLLQRLLAERSLLTPMMEPATRRWAGVVLIAAGAYQLAPLKGACLQACRSPIAFITRHWREGVAGAFRMGVVHGVYCLGCCWGLMLLLFAGGVMNLAVILALTIWVIAEKTLPFGEQGARVGGALLIIAGVWMMVA